MRSIKKIALYSFCTLVFVLLAFGLNLWIDALIIPDPCIYHAGNASSNVILSVFYSFPPAGGGHPQQSRFNLILTFTIGVSIGIMAARLLRKRFSARSNTNLRTS